MQTAMAPETLIPEKTSLLFFDMLNGHVKKDDAATRERNRPVVANAVRLLERARAKGVMVAYANASHRADDRTSVYTLRDTDNRLRPLAPEANRPVVVAGTWEAQVIDELAPREPDYVIPKYRWSAFHQTCLDLALRARGIDTVVIAGGSTDIGIASTAFAARDLDYHLVVVRDACASPETDNHDQFMRRVFPRMARVRTTDEVLAMLDPPRQG